MACFEHNLHTQISGRGYPCEHYFLWRLPLWGHLLCSVTHYDITMGNTIASDVHYDVTLSNNIVV